MSEQNEQAGPVITHAPVGHPGAKRAPGTRVCPGCGARFIEGSAEGESVRTAGQCTLCDELGVPASKLARAEAGRIGVKAEAIREGTMGDLDATSDPEAAVRATAARIEARKTRRREEYQADPAVEAEILRTEFTTCPGCGVNYHNSLVLASEVRRNGRCRLCESIGEHKARDTAMAYAEAVSRGLIDGDTLQNIRDAHATDTTMLAAEILGNISDLMPMPITHLRPGDMVLVEQEEPMTAAHRAIAKDILQSAFPDQTVVFVPAGTSLRFARQEGQEPAGEPDTAGDPEAAGQAQTDTSDDGGATDGTQADGASGAGPAGGGGV
jgi:hypothetical protein